MIVLALDPGHSTGLAAVSYNEPVGVQTKTLFTYEYETPIKFRNWLKRILVRWNPDVVIIERLPAKLDRKMADIYGTCQETVLNWSSGKRTISFISPGEWKVLANKTKIYETTRSQHEKDVYRMALYWLFKYQGLRL